MYHCDTITCTHTNKRSRRERERERERQTDAGCDRCVLSTRGHCTIELRSCTACPPPVRVVEHPMHERRQLADACVLSPTGGKQQLVHRGIGPASMLVDASMHAEAPAWPETHAPDRRAPDLAAHGRSVYLHSRRPHQIGGRIMHAQDAPGPEVHAQEMPGSHAQACRKTPRRAEQLLTAQRPTSLDTAPPP